MSMLNIVSKNNLICKPVQPYDLLICDFIDSYSVALRHDMEARTFSDVMTFAFWARRANILKKKEDYAKRSCGQERLGKGIIFHIAPSNVPVNCMYSYVFGLLAGNSNIVRLPSKEFPQIQCMLRVLDEVLKKEEFSELKEMSSFVRYDRNDVEYTKKYSSVCDMRVIWGGDNTIREIRKIELPSRSTEITFADRYSFGIADVQTVFEMSDDELKSLTEGFYNDTYLMDQNACSTPHLICWKKGGMSDAELEHTKKRFWNGVFKTAKKYDLDDIKVSDKYTDLCEYVMNVQPASHIVRYDNLLYVCELLELPSDIMYRCRGRYGMFFEYTLNSFDELSVLSDTKVQTCAVCGIEQDVIRDYIIKHHLMGIDRVVPFGKTLDIDTIWDGYDLIVCMSRVIG